MLSIRNSLLSVGALALVAAVAVPVLGKDPKPDKMLKKGIATADVSLVAKALEDFEDSEKSAKSILKVALAIDALEKFNAADANKIFNSAKSALAQMEDPKALKYVYKAMEKDRDYRVRVILVEVAGVKDGADAEAAIIEALDDKHPTVAGTAAKQLGAKDKFHDVNAVVTALIGRLDATEKKRQAPWQDMLRSLVQISGEEIELAEDWGNWWSGAQADFGAAPKAKGRSIGGTVSRNAPKMFGKEILSKHVVFVLDTSGSMELKDIPPEKGRGFVSPKDGQAYLDLPKERMRMERLKKAMIATIKELPGDTRFGIVTFASQVRKWRPKLEPASKSKGDAIKFTEGMVPSGFTWTDVALTTSFEFPDATAIYLFSDGTPQRGKTANGGADYIDKSEILEKVRQLNRTRKIKIYTFGFGEADASFMSTLAAENGGEFTAVQ
ncbi:MAG: VWA domain-containing protein [Planctomycetota bacterium]|jgi:hypothetical protein